MICTVYDFMYVSSLPIPVITMYFLIKSLYCVLRLIFTYYACVIVHCYVTHGSPPLSRAIEIG